MTVTYSKKVATSSFSCFLKLLCRWRGSIYKLMWREFAVFAIIYYVLSFVYRLALSDNGKRQFEKFALYCEKFNNLIPVAFILGFYVSLVVSRFWDQLNALPWPTRLAVFVSTLVQGHDDRSRLTRRTIMRYLSLSYVLTMRHICQPVLKRFPDYQLITDAGIMTDDEQKALENIQDSRKSKPKVYFVPLVWAARLVTLARKEGRIKDDFAVKTLIDEINDYRGKCGALFCYDWVNVPLVYTQVVTIAVHTFFVSCLMGRQYLEGSKGDNDTEFESEMYFPVFTFLQFFFYMGWLKVAEMLINPFGEDDDDFEINSLIDSNLEISYLIVDDMHAELPNLVQDRFWDKQNVELPYTKAAEPFRVPEYQGSAVPSQGAMAAIREEDEGGSDDRRMDQADYHGSFRRQASVVRNLSNSIRTLFSRSTSHVGQRTSPMEIETESRPSSVSSSKGVHVRQAGSLPPSRAVPARQIAFSSRGRYASSLQSTREETQFEMTDIDEDHKLLPNEASVKSDAKIHQPVPLARFDSDAGFDERLHSHDVLDSPAVHQTDGGEFGMSLSYTNPKLVDDVRQQLKLMRETSTDQSSLKSPLS